ncbi:translation elongation factor Ts [Methylovirgula sp. 4M-Z18]|uniref:translation elongation factor Ts n=1 Tax=Methylovirgula sp. 4M-Z18 TaxID=2293567 RepID=UPI000E2F4685|nr:translation elongation factor Ts [Methylovirgula sp. 4M-Z18]RFB80213.1 elongation factor Ts [Methylovirgula sp. 4M-Z18]
MAEVTAAMVKDLREKTGAGMMDCKTALNETQGDIEAAIDYLRKKGLSKAAKKSGRVAAEGLVSVAVKGNTGVVVEVNSETDFVARNDDFQALVHGITAVTLDKGVAADVEAVKGAHYPGGGTVADAIANAIATIGENMTLRRVRGLHVPHGVVGQYIHGAVVEGLGKIGVIVALESTGDTDELSILARQIAMHVAATSPIALDSSSIDPAVVEREKSVLADKHQGKPANVIEKIVESGLKTYYKEVCLVDQVSIHADHAGKTIGQAVKDSEGKVGAPVKITGFVRYALGEGIEKQETDFAAEVASMSKA